MAWPRLRRERARTYASVPPSPGCWRGRARSTCKIGREVDETKLGRRNSSRRTISRYREFVDAEAGVHGVGLLQRSDSYIRRPRVDGVDWHRLRVDGMSGHHTFRMSRGSRTWDVRSPMRTSLAAKAGPATRPTSFPFDAELSSSSRAEFERHSSRRASERASKRQACQTEGANHANRATTAHPVPGEPGTRGNHRAGPGQ